MMKFQKDPLVDGEPRRSRSQERNAGVDPRFAAVLALQRSAGNKVTSRVISALESPGGVAAVVQRVETPEATEDEHSEEEPVEVEEVEEIEATAATGAPPPEGVAEVEPISEAEAAAAAEAARVENALRELEHNFPDLSDATFGMDRSFLPDLLRLQDLMSDGNRVIDLLQPLENVLAGQVGRDGTLPKRALTTALRAKEQAHGFSPAHVIALAKLGPEDFVKLPKLGRVLKDVGAGVAHGEVAHRLQWYAVCVDFENDPTKWVHPPIELYKKIGSRDVESALDAEGRPVEGGGSPLKMWPWLFDRPGEANARLDFKHPDTVTKTLGAEGGRLPTLSGAVARKQGKRRDAAGAVAEEMLRGPEARETLRQKYDAKSENPVLLAEEIAIKRYAKKKMKKRKLFRRKFTMNADGSLITRRGDEMPEDR